jgi:DNA helicase-4
LKKEKIVISEPRLLFLIHLRSSVTLTLDHSLLSIGNTTFPLNDMASQNKASSALKTLQSIDDHIRAPELARDRHNQSYALYWRDKAKDYFKQVESEELTEEQIQTALVFEDATLVVAAAGSGKNSCIVGKIGFALKTGLFNEGQILALAYNKKAALGLQTRLNKKLGKAMLPCGFIVFASDSNC